ncbi:MAG: hypothetical protein M1814_001949 [Vezdaea aestivalis]|nr:MAG: hypothetical protein M1814_001949 [Vezdaea aestivalis]
MSFYDAQPWSNQPRPQGWEQPPPPSRSGASSAVPGDDPTAFSSQIEEVDRAVDNLVKSGKLYGAMGGRRDSLPMIGSGGPRHFPDFDPRLGGMAPRHHSISDFDPVRSHQASNAQGFYANQRFQGRTNEPEGMAQTKRRMAAQRERELRNYHQEQQYNRNAMGGSAPASNRTDRTISPGNMSEEGRRHLITQQRNAIFQGEVAPIDTSTPRPAPNSAGLPPSATGRGPSPRNYDPFAMAQSKQGMGPDSSTPHSATQMHPPQAMASGPSPNVPQQRSRANSTSSPSSNPTSFSLFDNNNAQQSSRTSNSSPGGSSPTGKNPQTGNAGGVAPIGTRPVPGSQGAQAANPALNKGRSTTPLPSPLSYGFTSDDKGERRDAPSQSATQPSNGGNQQQQDVGVSLGWGNKSGSVWSTKPMGVWG